MRVRAPRCAPFCRQTYNWLATGHGPGAPLAAHCSDFSRGLAFNVDLPITTPPACPRRHIFMSALSRAPFAKPHFAAERSALGIPPTWTQHSRVKADGLLRPRHVQRGDERSHASDVAAGVGGPALCPGSPAAAVQADAASETWRALASAYARPGANARQPVPRQQAHPPPAQPAPSDSPRWEMTDVVSLLIAALAASTRPAQNYGER
jgi:hypothetical protein